MACHERGGIVHEPGFRISITLAVTDVAELWTAAFVKGLANPDLELDDIVELIGPARYPSIRDCIALLAEPGRISGCTVDDFWIDNLPIGLGRLRGAAGFASDDRRAPSA